MKDNMSFNNWLVVYANVAQEIMSRYAPEIHNDPRVFNNAVLGLFAWVGPHMSDPDKKVLDQYKELIADTSSKTAGLKLFFAMNNDPQLVYFKNVHAGFPGLNRGHIDKKEDKE